jgi:hypothetical protein
MDCQVRAPAVGQVGGDTVPRTVVWCCFVAWRVFVSCRSKNSRCFKVEGLSIRTPCISIRDSIA